MDKIDKFTRRLKHDIALRVLKELKNIRDGNTLHLDVKKLKGMDGSYRVRIGKIRIKFMRTSRGNTITDISFRADDTY